MRKKQLWLVITFHSTMEAMAAETFFSEKQLTGRIIPVPGEIKAGCGLAWMAPAEMKENILRQLNQAGKAYEHAGEYWL